MDLDLPTRGVCSLQLRQNPINYSEEMTSMSYVPGSKKKNIAVTEALNSTIPTTTQMKALFQTTSAVHRKL